MQEKRLEQTITTLIQERIRGHFTSKSDVKLLCIALEKKKRERPPFFRCMGSFLMYIKREMLLIDNTWKAWKKLSSLDFGGNLTFI